MNPTKYRNPGRAAPRAFAALAHPPTPLPPRTGPKYPPDGNLNVNPLRPSQVPAALLSRLSSLYGLKPRRIHRGIFTYFILNKDPTAAQVFYVEI